jgi:hypothetical protein
VNEKLMKKEKTNKHDELRPEYDVKRFEGQKARSWQETFR